jgi:hypothetical protein
MNMFSSADQGLLLLRLDKKVVSVQSQFSVKSSEVHLKFKLN